MTKDMSCDNVTQISTFLLLIVTISVLYLQWECRRGRTMRFLSVCLSVCPSVCLSNTCIVTKWKKDMFRFLYHTKEHLS